MRLKTEDCDSNRYAIISYAHSKDDADRDRSQEFKSELDKYDGDDIYYWYDESVVDGNNEKWSEQFETAFQKDNCKGIIFFISDRFFLSKNCEWEMNLLKNWNSTHKDKKFCLFVLPANYPNSFDEISDSVFEYVKNNNSPENRREYDFRKSRIELFLELCANYVRIGSDYIQKSCKEGVFNKIVYKKQYVGFEKFGTFPQIFLSESQNACKHCNKCVERRLDKKKTCYAPIEWLVIHNSDQKQALLSKKLLFAIDYLNLKYPLNPTSQTLEDKICGFFEKYFENNYNEKKYKYVERSVRFLYGYELKSLLTGYEKDLILCPQATSFAQISHKKNAPKFWLAGDINDAQRVDAATESLAEKVGVEVYYVRPVIEVEKIKEKNPDTEDIESEKK